MQNITYEIMHMEKNVAWISTTGAAEILCENFMPYDLYLEPGETDDIDVRMNNLANFYHWCASRMLTLDRQYAKAIFNSIGVSQATTDQDRARITLSYHCVSLTDVYWVREQGENITFAEVNLYDHSLNDAVVAISLKGRQMTVTNQELAQDISTGGCFPKAWIREQTDANSFGINGFDINSFDIAASQTRKLQSMDSELQKERENAGQSINGLMGEAGVLSECIENAQNTSSRLGFCLLKDGGETAVRRELLASKICRCFAIPQVLYEPYIFDDRTVTKSAIFTSKEYSIVTKMAFDIYAANHDLDTLQVCRSLDPVGYYGMNILDYLVGNTDRHAENWGFLIDNRTNKYVSLHPLMDFNQSFLSYDTLDGANCLTVLPERMTQREAAIDAVQHIGLQQLQEVDLAWFGDMKVEAQMFRRRLEELKKQIYLYDK